jgi:hypothetical protein
MTGSLQRSLEHRKHLGMVESEPHQLRVLIANEKRDRLELLAQVVTDLGHNVIARDTLHNASTTPRRTRPTDS